MFHKSDAKLDLLGQVSLFSACSKDELKALAKITTRIDVPRGKELCREGDIGHDCFIVVDGEAQVTINGEEIDTIGAGGFFGEMALLDGGPRVATVAAVTDMRLLVLTRPEFRTLLADMPSVSQKLLTAVGARLRQAHELLHPRRVGA